MPIACQPAKLVSYATNRTLQQTEHIPLILIPYGLVMELVLTHKRSACLLRFISTPQKHNGATEAHCWVQSKTWALQS